MFGAGAHQCGTTDILNPIIVVVQETFAEVVCPIIKPVEDEDIKTRKLLKVLSDQSQPSTFTSPRVDVRRSQEFLEARVRPRRRVFGGVGVWLG